MDPFRRVRAVTGDGPSRGRPADDLHRLADDLRGGGTRLPGTRRRGLAAPDALGPAGGLGHREPADVQGPDRDPARASRPASRRFAVGAGRRRRPRAPAGGGRRNDLDGAVPLALVRSTAAGVLTDRGQSRNNLWRKWSQADGRRLGHPGRRAGRRHLAAVLWRGLRGHRPVRRFAGLPVGQAPFAGSPWAKRHSPVAHGASAIRW